jgi:hypothetical protein
MWLLVDRGDIILEFTDGPLDSRAGPMMEFEYLPGMGISEIIHKPFQFLEGFSDEIPEPLHFYLPEEDAVALAQLLLRALHMISDYINS